MNTIELRNASQAVFIAVDGVVAESISKHLVSAANEIDELRAENERLKAEIADRDDDLTVAAMWAHHNRDDEVRELQAMCDELATQIIRCRTCMYPGDNCIGCLNDSALESYRAMTTNKSKVGE